MGAVEEMDCHDADYPTSKPHFSFSQSTEAQQKHGVFRFRENERAETVLDEREMPESRENYRLDSTGIIKPDGGVEFWINRSC